MVKSGRVVEHWKTIGRGRNRKTVREKAPVSSPVYFPEFDGEVDLMVWRLTENEAILAERWHEIMKDTQPKIDKAYEERRRRWNQACDELGLEDKKLKRPYPWEKEDS